ncbi:PLP-dependent aminotransferase family protein [Sporolactobacillus terrae]|uniref:Putative HTH-type transcriptional regulator YdfD n=1 Tax=Sporolactobacillus terrae TaxID=269673 RepID=A0A5K7X0R0_9BACL|nr:PLP-dependent aminotransferase family protein [Sporolactobacillus terrae]BBN98173.1 putative HTH-type transcriptional regulator YdfD [Sporolactobacillus terrae]
MPLKRQSAIPLYRQIQDYIAEKIKNGEWASGAKLPSQRALASFFHVNRSTIITALESLAAQGLIEGRRGGGTRVINSTWSLMAQKKATDWGTYVEAGRYKPNLPMIQKINQAEFNPRVIRMGTGELSPELLPSEKFTELVKALSPNLLSLGYQEPKGALHLREALSRHLKTDGINASPSSILVVSGALQALQLISSGLLDRGSSLLLAKPSYLYSVHVFQSLGMRFIGLPSDHEGLQPERLAACKRKYHGVILYTIPSFDNPTGALMPEKRRQQLLSVCQQEQLPIIEDDVYRELWLDAPPPPSLKSMDRSGNVLYVGSMSKVLSAGLRIGWIVGPEAVIERLADIKMQSDYGSSSLAQLAAAECLRTGLYQEHAAFVRKQLRMRRNHLVDLLHTYFADLGQWQIPSGGFYIWLELLPAIDPKLLFEAALRHDVLINPGVLYDRSARRYLRLSYAYASLQEMEQAMQRLRKIVLELAN